MSRLHWLRDPRQTGGRAWKHLRGWGREALRFIGANRVRLIGLVILVLIGVGSWRLIASWDWVSTEFWDWLRDGPDGVESGSTTIRNLGIVIGGVAAAGLAYWRSRVAECQADTAQQTLLNERYQQGAEMLGSEVLSVRLGGIYALERLAREHSMQYHIQIMQLFCAFLRHPTVDEREKDKSDQKTAEEGPVSRDLSAGDQTRVDLQAVLTAIGARDKTRIQIERAEGYTLDMSRSNLRGSYLVNADLSRTRFYGAILSYTFLDGADLSRAFLMEADLSHATLWRADMSDTILYDADLSGAELSRITYTLGSRTGPEGADPVVGLTQAQIDHARADLNNPPNLLDVIDATTGIELDWRGKPLAGQR